MPILKIVSVVWPLHKGKLFLAKRFTYIMYVCIFYYVFHLNNEAYLKSHKKGKVAYV